MPEKTIKHFIFMRFFSWYDPNYPHDIYDVDFLSKQLVLAKNALGSLENQTNKNFSLVFIVNERFLAEEKYGFIFHSLQNSTVLPIRFVTVPATKKNRYRSKYKWTEVHRLIRNALRKYDFVIQSRMDFDDFLYKDGIADTQSKVSECDSISAYGYCKGYRYVQGELYPFIRTYKGMGCLGVLSSLILKSDAARTLPFIFIYDFACDKAKPRLKLFLKKNGMKFSESMFRTDNSTNAFIYYRHEDSHATATRFNGDTTVAIQNEFPLTTADVTKKQLEDEFGFHLELKSIE